MLRAIASAPTINEANTAWTVLEEHPLYDKVLSITQLVLVDWGKGFGLLKAVPII